MLTYGCQPAEILSLTVFEWLDIKFSELNITGINNKRQLIFDILYTARLIFSNILSNTAIEVFLII